jgi:hypothetical protein
MSSTCWPACSLRRGENPISGFGPLPKPFSLKELASMVKAVVEGED